MEVVVPDLGDSSDVEVVEVLVGVGDTVAKEDSLVVLETDKASLEVPATHAGQVTELKVSVGDRVSSGDVILLLDAAEPAQPRETPAAEGRVAPAGDAIGDAAPPLESAAPKAAERVDVLVPDLGDFSDVEVVEVLVKVDDAIQAEAPLIVLETDKASMEVPSTHAGTIRAIDVAVGDRVSVGDRVLELEAVAAPERLKAAESAPGGPASTKQEPAVAHSPQPRPQIARQTTPVDERRFSLAHASPSVRKLARELGVDLGGVTGSGVKGRVTAADVKAFVKQIMLSGGSGMALPAVPEVDFASFGPIETRPLTRIQKISGPRLQASWLNLPHVTQHDVADVTELEEVRQELKEQAVERNVRLTPLAFVVRACVRALEEFPLFRSSLSPDGGSLVIKNYFHIGFAADTPNGLVVPVIKDADQLDIFGIAQALGALSEKARSGKLSPKDIQGAVFTISSLGGIGGTFFTPIVNAPEVAILGVSRSQMQPVYEGGVFVPRLMLPLSLSYDHRVIDGALAVRFTTRLGQLLGRGRELAEGAR
jgi:pyruvate dehydrogenase E2 component (dihydrolipoamide acetyltransferase)